MPPSQTVSGSDPSAGLNELAAAFAKATGPGLIPSLLIDLNMHPLFHIHKSLELNSCLLWNDRQPNQESNVDVKAERIDALLRDPASLRRFNFLIRSKGCDLVHVDIGRSYVYPTKDKCDLYVSFDGFGRPMLSNKSGLTEMNHPDIVRHLRPYTPLLNNLVAVLEPVSADGLGAPIKAAVEKIDSLTTTIPERGSLPTSTLHFRKDRPGVAAWFKGLEIGSSQQFLLSFERAA